MKIRYTGTVEELDKISEEYFQRDKNDKLNTVQVSNYYPMRGSSTLFRLYVEINKK